MKKNLARILSQSPYKGFNRIISMITIIRTTQCLSQSPYKGFNRNNFLIDHIAPLTSQSPYKGFNSHKGEQQYEV